MARLGAIVGAGAALVVLLSATSEAEPPVPRSAAGWCAAHSGDALPADVDVRWRGDLDGDGRRGDVIVRHHDGCGTRECMYEAFVTCGGGAFASVMSPGYGDKVRVTRPRRGWAQIAVRVVGESRDPRERYAWVALRMGPDGYGDSR